MKHLQPKTQNLINSCCPLALSWLCLQLPQEVTTSYEAVEEMGKEHTWSADWPALLLLWWWSTALVPAFREHKLWEQCLCTRLKGPAGEWRICCVCKTELKKQPDKSKRMKEESIDAFLLFSLQYPTHFQSLLTWGDAFLPKEVFSLPRRLGICKILWAGMGTSSCAYAKAKGFCSYFGKSIRELPAASAHKCQEGKSRSENVCFKMVFDWLLGR